MKNCIHAYVKLKETEDYLKTEIELKLFGWRLDFFKVCLKIGVLGIKFKNLNLGN